MIKTNSQISAKIIADSCNSFGNRITTMVVTFPRFILAELNTHRMFSRNSASSRAIPFEKMVKSVEENPFIPIAWQKEHKGMQGNKYIIDENHIDYKKRLWLEARDNAVRSAKNLHENISFIGINGWKNGFSENDEKSIYNNGQYEVNNKTSIFEVKETSVTKQLCNRLLEPFMWHTVIVTATEWENFFALRCPQYTFSSVTETVIEDKLISGCIYRNATLKMENGININTGVGGAKLIIDTYRKFGWQPLSSITPAKPIFRSRKDYCRYVSKHNSDMQITMAESDWLYINKGQAEIHMMTLAEAMWDAYNESTPKKLKAGEWHIPFGDDINPGFTAYAKEHSENGTSQIGYPSGEIIRKGRSSEESIDILKVKIATAMCARVSYTVVGEEDKEPNYENDIKLHDRLAGSGHWSPFEHCAKAIGDEYKGKIYTGNNHYFGNFRGFIQYRKMFNNENITN